MCIWCPPPQSSGSFVTFTAGWRTELKRRLRDVGRLGRAGRGWRSAGTGLGARSSTATRSTSYRTIPVVRIPSPALVIALIAGPPLIELTFLHHIDDRLARLAAGHCRRQIRISDRCGGRMPRTSLPASLPVVGTWLTARVEWFAAPPQSGPRRGRPSPRPGSAVGHEWPGQYRRHAQSVVEVDHGSGRQ